MVLLGIVTRTKTALTQEEGLLIILFDGCYLQPDDKMKLQDQTLLKNYKKQHEFMSIQKHSVEYKTNITK